MPSFGNAPFNPANYDPSQGAAYSNRVSGTVDAVAFSSDVKQTAAGGGGFVLYEFRVISGEFAGDILPLRLNLWNSSDQAREIAERQMAAFCIAVGKGNLAINSTEELHNIPIKLQVDIQENEVPNRTTGKTTKVSQSVVRKVLNPDGSLPSKGQQPPASVGAPGGPAAPYLPQQPTQPVQQPQQPAVAPAAAWGGPAPAQQPQPQQPQQPQQPPATAPAAAPWAQGNGMPPGAGGPVPAAAWPGTQPQPGPTPAPWGGPQQ